MAREAFNKLSEDKRNNSHARGLSNYYGTAY